MPVVDHQSGVPIHVYGEVPKMSLTPGRIWRGAASIGEDATDILTTMPGLTEPQIATLYNDRVVHRTARPVPAGRRHMAAKTNSRKRGYDIVQLREWAGANKVAVPSRGRIPQAVVDQYKAAGGR